MTHGQTLRAYLDWCDWADLRPGDRYLIVEPVLPHLRVQGRLPRVPHARRDDLPARGLRRRGRARARRTRADHRAARAADDLPVAARPSRPGARDISSLRRRGDRRGRHPGRAHPARRARSCRSSASSPATGSPRPGRSPAAGPTTTSSTSRRRSACRGPASRCARSTESGDDAASGRAGRGRRCAARR